MSSFSANSAADPSADPSADDVRAPILVDNPAAFAQMMAVFGERRRFAIDTESDSLFSYYPKVCLLQISAYAAPGGDNTANVVDYLVDTLTYPTLEPLGRLLAQPGVEVVMHAAENDLLLLQREFGFEFACVFDTQLAARVLGWQQAGLAAILDECFGVISDKSMQRTNWSKRPLTAEQIAYAQIDTHYLFALQERLTQELKDAGRWEEAQEDFALLVQTDYSEKEPPARTMWQMKETRGVARRHTGVLEALWQWREAEAQRRDIPPFKILRNRALTELAEAQPSSERELDAVSALGRTEIQRYGKHLLHAIAEGRSRPLPDLPAPTVRPEQLLERDVLTRYDTLRRWRTRTAEARGVAPEIIFANGILLEIAKRRPRSASELLEIREIGPWKAKTYGPAILEIVAK